MAERGCVEREEGGGTGRCHRSADMVLFFVHHRSSFSPSLLCWNRRWTSYDVQTSLEDLESCYDPELTIYIIICIHYFCTCQTKISNPLHHSLFLSTQRLISLPLSAQKLATFISSSFINTHLQSPKHAHSPPQHPSPWPINVV